MENEKRQGEGPRSGRESGNDSERSEQGHARARLRAAREQAPNRLPPSRQGKKAVTAYVEPEMHKQLRLLGLELGKSSQEMIIEALRAYFERQGVGS